MSIKKPQIIFYILLLVGYFTYHHFFPQNRSENIKRSFSGVHSDRFTSYGPVDRVVEINIKAKKLENDLTELTATFSSAIKPDQNFYFKWILGPDLSLHLGDKDGFVTVDHPNQSLQQSITVKGFNSEQLRHIKLEIIGKKGSRQIYGDYLISNHPEKSFEKFVQKIEIQKTKNLKDHQ